ncbi:MAG: NAD(P)H-dependent oxidoreductase [Bacteroidales bacterium]
MSLIEDLKWRYATKKFDPTKRVDSVQLEKIKEAIRLAPSSLGLQPFQVLQITNPDLRAQLREVSWGQSAVTDADILLVFCNMTEVSDNYLEYMADLMQKERHGSDESKAGYLNFVKGYMHSLTPEEIKVWSAEECYIAATIAMAACAELQLDSCPIGGFDPKEYDRLLNLSAQKLNATLVLPIGYRAADDEYQFAAKVRKPMDELFRSIK